MSLDIDPSWKTLLQEEFRKEYYQNIHKFLESEVKSGKTIYPHSEDIFAAFRSTPVEEIKVIILGQDPYHGEGQAHGLSFSVQDGVKIPPSLRNIYKEIKDEYPDYEIPTSGNLEHWSSQGILLINSIMTVEKSQPGSHAKCGWSKFTDAVLEKISDSQEGIIFVLWGNFARSKKQLINHDKHYVLESPHPSPFSAYNGFFGNGHFRKVNDILKSQGNTEIMW